MKAPAFQLYAADFYMDTVGWTCEEVGLYFRLLMAEWVNGPFQNDPVRLAKTCQISVKKFQVNFKNVLPKFTQNGEGYLQNERLEKSRNEHSQFIENQREKGKKRASKMWDGHIAVAKKRLQPEVQPEDSSSSSSSTSKDKKNIKKKTVTASVTYSEDFLKWYEKYPQKINKKKAFEAWKVVMLPSDGITGPPTLEYLLQKLQEQINGRESMKKSGQWVPDWPHPTTYLNGDRWMDEFMPDAQGKNNSINAEVEAVKRKLNL